MRGFREMMGLMGLRDLRGLRGLRDLRGLRGSRSLRGLRDMWGLKGFRGFRFFYGFKVVERVLVAEGAIWAHWAIGAEGEGAIGWEGAMKAVGENG